MGNTNNDSRKKHTPPASETGDGDPWHKNTYNAISGATNKDGAWSKAITDVYDVAKKELGKGGLGKVFLFTNRLTGMKFAVKQPLVENENSRRTFLRELLIWSDLPEHPNLVPCRAFQIVGKDILIFAEYMEGGSLLDLIKSKQLYKGRENQVLARILDTAIQFAWGLHCIHELGLIHRDVKPANVLMSNDAKAALYGLRASVSDYGLVQDNGASGKQGTKAYRSPEQGVAGSKLDHGTDLWSWGISVLQMFQGSSPGSDGLKAAEYLKIFLKHNGKFHGIPAMPAGVAEVLKGCFIKDPAERLKSVKGMDVVVDSLKSIYRDAILTKYNRPLVPIAHRDVPLAKISERRMYKDESWLDPRVWLEKALQAGGRDPAEAAAILPRRGNSRRGELVADIVAYDEARILFEGLINDGKTDLANDLINLCREAALIHQAAGSSSGALALYSQVIKILEQLVNVEHKEELAYSLANIYLDKGLVVLRLKDYRSCVALYDQAIKIYERLVRYKLALADGRVMNESVLTSLAIIRINRTLALHLLKGEVPPESLSKKLIAYLERSENTKNQRKLGTLSTFSQSVTLFLGESRSEVAIFDSSIKTLEQQIDVAYSGELARKLAENYLRKASLVKRTKDYSFALTLYDKAIKILDRLVNAENRDELATELAKAYRDKASLVADSKDGSVVTWYVMLKHFLNFGHSKDYSSIVILYDQAIKILERLVLTANRYELADDLATLFKEKANILAQYQNYTAAKDVYDRAIEMFVRLVNVEKHGELHMSLATLRVWRGWILIRIGYRKQGTEQIRSAIPILRAEAARSKRTDLWGMFALACFGSPFVLLRRAILLVIIVGTLVSIGDAITQPNVLLLLLAVLGVIVGFYVILVYGYLCIKFLFSRR